MASFDALAPGMTDERAAEIFAMMTSPANWRQLTVDARWSFDDAEAWLTQALQQLLLNSPA